MNISNMQFQKAIYLFQLAMTCPLFLDCSNDSVISALLSIKIHRGTERGRLKLTGLTELLALFHSAVSIVILLSGVQPFLPVPCVIYQMNCLSFKRQRERSSSIHIAALLISDILFCCAQELVAMHGLRTEFLVPKIFMRRS